MENFLRKLITDYIKPYPDFKKTSTVWQEPVIAFAAADDYLFANLKETIAPTHAMPADLLADAQTVITYFIPFAKDIVISNGAGRETSREWAVAYIETNQLILDLNAYVHDQLSQHGYQASILPATHNFDTQKLLSDWSHRHAAFIAGLGTFGLNNMLITEKGCCGRVGSIITTLKLQPTQRNDGENCLYHRHGLCKKCVERCVNGALQETSFDRHLCYDRCLYNAEVFSELGLADVCGKCLINLPCSFINPTPKTS
ncbi:MAG: epoxyqueuosine reductase [Sporomusaceae bacterium]|nr:epoxyqueuosine reductase [Sporomusaceae bacterium]